MLNYDITRMKDKAEFGVTQSFKANNYNGRVEYFVPQFSVWCGEYTNTQTQTYDNLGTHVDVDMVIVIRHNPNVNSNKILVCYKNVNYKIVAISSDDRLNAFDTISLKRDNSFPKRIPEDTSKLVPYGSDK
ncbi:phage head closure protein [Limosilactobacillus reuteri]|nr:phage head closure protein [Limosilactobacillus reuteri]MCH5385706.1 phage head closure protein [Limosilactobacillus reuteri]